MLVSGIKTKKMVPEKCIITMVNFIKDSGNILFENKMKIGKTIKKKEMGIIII